MKRVTTNLIPHGALRLQLICAGAILAVCAIGFLALQGPGNGPRPAWTIPLMTLFGLGILLSLVYLTHHHRRRWRGNANSVDLEVARYRYRRALQELESDPGNASSRRHAFEAERAYTAAKRERTGQAKSTRENEPPPDRVLT